MTYVQPLVQRMLAFFRKVFVVYEYYKTMTSNQVFLAWAFHEAEHEVESLQSHCFNEMLGCSTVIGLQKL